MARIRIGARVALSLSGVAIVRQRISDLRRARTALVSAIRRTVAQEFRDGAGFTENGGRAPWAKTVEFGTSPGDENAFEGSAYRRAWTTEGAGSYAKVTAKTVEVGVLPSRFPWVEAHRGKYPGQKFTVIRAKKRAKSKAGRILEGAQKWAAFWAVLKEKEVALSEKTLRVTGLQLPIRVHGRRSVQMRAAIVRALEAWIFRGET